MDLRPYQRENIAELRTLYADGQKRVLYVAPTGSGKSTLLRHLLGGARGRTLILAHRIELIAQIRENLGDMPHAVIGDGEALVMIGMVQTAARRLGSLGAFKWIISDEAHLSLANGWSKVLGAYPDAYHLGLTATPTRLDGRSLASRYDKILMGPTIADLVRDGYLSPLRTFAPPEPSGAIRKRCGDFVAAAAAQVYSRITGDAIAHFIRLASDRQALVWCCTREHARQVAIDFSLAGFSADFVTGDHDMVARADIFRRFRDRRLQILVSVDLASTGLDIPAVSCGIMLRPTDSEALFLQQAGRLMRVSPGKSDAILLDHAGNTLRHGSADAPRDWVLGEPNKRLPRTSTPVRTCWSCFYAQAPGRITCEGCGVEFPIEHRELEVTEGDLEEMKIAARRKKSVIGQARTLEQLKAVAKMYGYKEGWAWFIYNGRRGKK